MRENNQREYPRVVKAYFTAAKWYADNGEPLSGDIGKMINLSEGGVALEVMHPPEFLSILELNLGFEKDIVKVRGEVTRLSKNENGLVELGIKFIDISEKDRQIILDSLSSANETKTSR